MAQLFITYKSQDYAEIELEEGQEYLIGRSEDADIPLEGEQSLSRKHSTLYYQDGSWIIKKLSLSGQLLYKNEEVENQALENQSVFNIGDFSFVFQSTPLKEPSNSAKKEEIPKPEDNIDEKEDQQVLPKSEENNSLSESEDSHIINQENKEHTSEYTAIIKTNLTAQLNIYKPGQTLPESVNLTENSWVIGRAKDCNTSINYVKLSRYHFEITKDSSNYWVTDLGSANGTKLNGTKLKKNESQELKHNDNIEVKSLKITFEIINDNYKNFQLASINPEKALEINNKPTSLSAYLPLLKEKPYLYIGVIFIVIMVALFSLEDKKPSPKNTNKIKKLKPEQLQLLEDNLRLAQTHYTSGKYQLCNATLNKIHISINFYKNSKELEQYCKQAYQLRQEQEEKRHQVEEKEKINNKIISIVKKCKQKFTSGTLSNSKASSCLYPAIEINPNHPDIADLKSLIQSKIIQTENTAAKNKKNNQLYKKGLRKYQKALTLYNKNQLRASIKEFQKFLNSSYYGARSLKIKAKKTLQKAKSKFSAIIGSSLSKCKKALNNKQYKKAASFCRKVLQQDPDNIKASTFLKSALQKSRKELKEVYKNSVFEESVGSVEVAKKMWKDMLNKGIPNEEYYEKANRKLQKYEGL